MAIQLTETTYFLSDETDSNSENKFLNCVTAICERDSLKDPYKAGRRVSKITGAAISAIAKVPFAPVSFRLGKVLAPISIAGNSSAFFILEYWAAAGTSDDLLGPKTEAEIELLESKKIGKGKICRTFVVISAASLIALASQLPTALAGAEYNPKRFKFAAGLALLLSGSIIPIRSLQLSIEQIRKTVRRGAQYKIAQIKAKMTVLIKETHGAFIQKDRRGKLAFAQQCNAIRRLNISSTKKTNRYVLTLLEKNVLPISSTKKIIGHVFNAAGFAIGASLAGVFEYAVGEYTYDLARKDIYDNDIAGGVFTALAVGSTAYLFGTSIIKTTRRIFNLFGNAITGKEVRNLGWQLRPKLSFALTSVGLLIDVFALGPTYVIWGDFYDNNEVEHEFFRETMCASLFLLLFTSTLDIIDEIVTSSIAYGTEEEQEILKINGEFQRLSALVEKSPAQEFFSYLANLDESTKEQLFERMGLSASQLDIFSEQIA